MGKRGNTALTKVEESSKIVPTVVSATIDLHGYRKSEAIVALTSFLDQVVSRQRQQRDYVGGDVWVLVITGSGAHSPHGPVLRNAVEALLKKRQIQFTMNRGKGSFNVKANSGVIFYKPDPPSDTKVITVPAPKKMASIPKPPRLTNFDRVTLDFGDDTPTLREVAATDKAIEESRREHQEMLKEQKKDEQLLKRAVSLSRLQAKKEEEEEQEIMHRAVSMSLLDSPSCVDEGLQRALELSQKEFDRYTEECDPDFQEALKLSQLVSSRADDELLQVLELSKKECEGNDSWSFGLAEDT